MAQGHGSALELLDRDESNIRAALSRLLELGEGERVARAGWSLLPYWTLRERVREGRRTLEDAVAAEGLSDAARARARAAGALLAFWGSDYEAAARWANDALDELHRLGDDAGIAVAQIPLGVGQTLRGACDAGTKLLEDSRRRAENAGAAWGVAMSLLARAWALNAAGVDAPLALYEETVLRARALGHEAETVAMGALGRRRALRGDVPEAKAVLSDTLRRVLALDVRIGIGLYLDLLGDLAAHEHRDELAVRLSSAAEVVFEGMGTGVPLLVGDRDGRLERLRARLGERAFASEREAGRSRSTDEAASEALAWAGASRPREIDASGRSGSA